MKIALLIPIRLYWLVVPKHKRKTCLFKESCSNYVYRITKKAGLVNGIKALIHRKNVCRNGYQFIFKDDNTTTVQLADKSVITSNELSDRLITEANVFKQYCAKPKQ